MKIHSKPTQKQILSVKFFEKENGAIIIECDNDVDLSGYQSAGVCVHLVQFSNFIYNKSTNGSRTFLEFVSRAVEVKTY